MRAAAGCVRFPLSLPTSDGRRGLPQYAVQHQIVAMTEQGRCDMQPESFTLTVPDHAIADLRERLARTRYPDQAPGAPWAYGTDVGYLQRLVAYWLTAFDWRTEEARLNSFPQSKVPLCGIDLPFLDVPRPA